MLSQNRWFALTQPDHMTVFADGVARKAHAFIAERQVERGGPELGVEKQCGAEIVRGEFHRTTEVADDALVHVAVGESGESFRHPLVLGQRLAQLAAIEQAVPGFEQELFLVVLCFWVNVESERSSPVW